MQSVEVSSEKSQDTVGSIKRQIMTITAWLFPTEYSIASQKQSHWLISLKTISKIPSTFHACHTTVSETARIHQSRSAASQQPLDKMWKPIGGYSDSNAREIMQDRKSI